MKKYICKEVQTENGGYLEIEEELILCEDCKWGREISGNIECNVDRNNPPEYHGYTWFCPCGERKEENK